jgi:uncharacterized membrane protein
MKQGTDERALVGAIIGAGFGYAFGSGKSWAWAVAIALMLVGLYALEKMDDQTDIGNNDDVDE